MRFIREHHNTCASLVLLLLLAAPAVATLPQDQSIVVSANGNGLLKMGQEELKITAVVAKLKDDGTVEINLVSDITVFVSGTWSNPGESKTIFNLEITGGATKGAVEGNGKLVVKPDGKTIESLNLQVINKATKRTIDVTFAAR
jgi:hypothetical protein